MKRNFSAFEKHKLLLMVKIVEPDNVIESAKDWFDDKALNYLQMHFNVFGAIKSLGAINTYHLAMIDKDNVSAQKIEEIFVNVNALDQSYNVIFNNRLNLIVGYSNLLQKYRNCIFTGNSRFCYQNSVKKIQESELYKSYGYTYLENCLAKDPDIKTNKNRKGEYITLFETIFPDYKEDMNAFFEPMGGQYQTDIDNIKYIVYNAEEPYRSLFLDNVEGVNLSFTEGGSSYDSVIDTINFNWTNPEKTTEDKRGDYAGFFHEFGHYLDDINGKNGKFITEYFIPSDGKKLLNSGKEDLRRLLEKKIREKYPDCDQNTMDSVITRLMTGNLPNYEQADSADVEEKSKEIQKIIYKELESAKASGISDTYDGLTNYLREYRKKGNEEFIPSDYYSINTGKGVGGLWQHNNDYYCKFTLSDDKKTMTIDSYDDRRAMKESFATYYSVKIRGDEESLTFYNDYLDHTTEGFNELIAQIASGGN